MSDETSENEGLIAERNQLLGEIARLRVAKQTGVPVSMLGNGATEEAARALAEQAQAWAAETTPEPPTTSARPAYSTGQISRQTLGHLSPADAMAMYRAGKLEGIGAPAPPPGRNGEHNAAT